MGSLWTHLLVCIRVNKYLPYDCLTKCGHCWISRHHESPFSF
ncbi:MAG: hypothetical protein ACTS4V_01260 [Candidatus Hodgkinia cicadicola]